MFYFTPPRVSSAICKLCASLIEGDSSRAMESLESMLRNETDVCFRRRALVCFRFLNLGPTDHLLDCGCGRGFFVNMANRAFGATVTGVELESELLEIARTGNSSPNVDFIPGSVTKLPFNDKSFKKIIFSEVLEHIPDEKTALKEVFRVTAPGGTVALTVPNHRYPFLWDPINWVLEALRIGPIRTGVLSGIWANHERLYTVERLRELVDEVGFSIEEQEFITYFCFPFSHNLVYGLGKELLLAGLLPRSMENAADRFSYDRNSGSLLNPINFARMILMSIDRLNEVFPPRRSSVIIALKLRKPDVGN